MKRPTLAFACAAALSGLVVGCSFAPDYRRPGLPVTNEYPADAPIPPAVKADTPNAAEVAWRDYFIDPQLQAMIAQALEHNRDLRVTALRVLEARAAYQIRRADQFPTLDATAGEARARIPGQFTGTGPTTAAVWYVGVSVVGWELDFWGRVRNLKDAALEEFLATDSARRAVTVTLVAQVADGYFTLRELDERIRVTRETIQTREQSLRIFRRRFEVGTANRLDVTQVETLLTQAQTLGAQLEQARAAQAHALTLLVGAAPAGLADRANLNDAGALVSELRVGLPSDLLQQRPDIVAAEHRLKAANANIGAARAAFFPRITLTGFFGTASPELSGLFDGGTKAWLFMPQITLPIFDGGRRQANLDVAKVRTDAAVAEYERTIQSAFRDVADALSAQQWLAEQIAIQRRAVAAQQERARLAQMRYDRGTASFLEVLDAQRDLLTAEQLLVQQRRALLSSRVALYAALGGGSQHYGEPPESTARYDPQQPTR
jgi:multidrug efflux system outer membrane protein